MNKTVSNTVDELLGMAYDAYARARSSPDASTKQNLTRQLMTSLDRPRNWGEDVFLMTVFQNATSASERIAPRIGAGNGLKVVLGIRI